MTQPTTLTPPRPPVTPPPPVLPPAPPPLGFVQRVVRRFTYPVEAPITSITLYYLAFIAVATPLALFVPILHGAFAGERLEQMVASTSGLMGDAAGSVVPHFGFSLEFALLLAVAMIGAFLLMVPATWVYMATRRKKGFDQGVVQTMLLLALSVAGVIVIVRNSVALAFSLAGIVGAVRYRNNLPDTRDTLFIFLAIGVGLAAGVGTIPAAAALSMVFCYMVLVMTRMDYGMCELGRPSTMLLHLPTTTTPAETNGKKEKKRADFNSVLVVRVTNAVEGRRLVEPFLSHATKRWSLVEVEANDNGRRAHLKYLLRLSRKQAAEDVEDAVLEAGRPIVIGARIH